MAFRRALWHSGLTYQRTCEECKTVVQYMDDKLDFRPWFADGFVYCPRCGKPLRHDEKYAINVPEAPQEPVVIQRGPDSEEGAFCTQCGKAFREDDRFCSQCGNKR